MNLTEAQTRELLRLYQVHIKTVGTYDWPDGKVLRLRTGKYLAEKGLVKIGNAGSANRYPKWRITEQGMKIARNLIEGN